MLPTSRCCAARSVCCCDAAAVVICCSLIWKIVFILFKFDLSPFCFTFCCLLCSNNISCNCPVASLLLFHCHLDGRKLPFYPYSTFITSMLSLPLATWIFFVYSHFSKCQIFCERSKTSAASRKSLEEKCVPIQTIIWLIYKKKIRKVARFAFEEEHFKVRG